jgi:predicted nucleic acid-binding protein
MQQRVYIETSIPSFYHEDRQDTASVARREWTRQWWDNGRYAFEIVTSIAVIEELMDGNYAKQQACLSFLDEVPLLPIEEEIAEIVEIYTVHKLMPANPTGDALHLAIASYYKCDFLLTWNCKHLANANKYQHIRRVNTLLGLFVPTLTTPLELLGDLIP